LVAEPVYWQFYITQSASGESAPMSIECEGKYFGTEIDEKWWKRYTKNKLLARGNGIFSYNDDAIKFLRKLTKTPIEITFEDIVAVKTGKWHSGQWGAGQKIIKVLWKKDGRMLSSGFSIALSGNEIDVVVAELNSMID
jgi:hypothetical protein